MAPSSVLCGGLFAVVRWSKGVISIDVMEGRSGEHMNYLPGDVPYSRKLRVEGKIIVMELVT